MRRTYLRLLKYFLVRKPQSPIQLIHFITSKCNAKCGHCFYWRNLNTKGELSLEEIEKVTKHLPDLIFLNISGGEPFIRPDFAEVIKTYYRNTCVKEVSVPTNGTFTEKMVKDCTEILEHCPNLDLNIVFSLDGIEPIHDEIRQVKDCFKTAVGSFKILQEMQKKYPRLQVSVVSTLTSLNQDTLEQFHSQVKQELGPDVLSLNIIRGEAKKMELFGVNLDNYKKFYHLERKSKKKGVKAFLRNYMNKLRMEVIVKNIEKKEYVLPCEAGNLLGVMYEKGDVYPCEMLNNRKLGNVRDFDFNFTKLWTAQVTTSTSKWIKDSKCYCTHECFLRFNLFYKPGFVAKSFVKSLGRKSELDLGSNQTGSVMGKSTAATQDQGEEMIRIGASRGTRATTTTRTQEPPKA